jgi:hypothetical protein
MEVKITGSFKASVPLSVKTSCVRNSILQKTKGTGVFDWKMRIRRVCLLVVL